MEDLNKGSVLRKLLNISGAVLVNTTAGVLFTLINFFWLGRLGLKAQAAVALASGPVSVVLTLVPIITVGSRVLISQAVGAKDPVRANRIFNETFGASFIVMVIVGLGAWFARARFGELLTPDRETASMISDLLCWYIPAIVVQIPSATMAAALGGTGNVKAAMLAQLLSVGVNIVISPIVIFGWLGLPALGIFGSGVASFISALSSAAVLSIFIGGGANYLRMIPNFWLSRPHMLWQAFRVGLPIGMQGGILAIYLIVVIQILRPFGPSEQAAFGIGQRLMQAGIMPIVALSSAVSLMAGQGFGAGLSARIRQSFTTALGIGFVVVPLIFLGAQIFAVPIVKAFTNDSAVNADTVRYLRIVSFNLFPLTVSLCCFGVLTGLGNTRASLITVTVSSVLMLVPTWGLSLHPGFRPSWVWILMVASSCVETVMALLFMRAEFRKQHYILKAAPPALELA